MNAWVWWLVAAGGLAAGEIVTLAFVLGLIGVGALAGAAAASLGGSSFVQLLTFAVVSVLMIVVVRPIAARHLKTPRAIRTGAAALVGADAVALSVVDGDGGQVKLRGEIWSARSFSGEEISAGERVEVVNIDGATAVVLAKESSL